MLRNISQQKLSARDLLTLVLNAPIKLIILRDGSDYKPLWYINICVLCLAKEGPLPGG